MTLDRAAVEQMLETIAGDSYLNARDARALAEDWLRKDEALEALLDYAERYHGGDPTITSEWWYAVRDAARLALAAQTEEEKL